VGAQRPGSTPYVVCFNVFLSLCWSLSSCAHKVSTLGHQSHYIEHFSERTGEASGAAPGVRGSYSRAVTSPCLLLQETRETRDGALSKNLESTNLIEETTEPRKEGAEGPRKLRCLRRAREELPRARRRRQSLRWPECMCCRVCRHVLEESDSSAGGLKGSRGSAGSNLNPKPETLNPES